MFTLAPLLSGIGRAHHGDILREAVKLIVSKKLTVLLNAASFDLEAINEAHAVIESGKAAGKVMIEITD